jgi:uncharacterized protein (TIGR02996 family)
MLRRMRSVKAIAAKVPTKVPAKSARAKPPVALDGIVAAGKAGKLDTALTKLLAHWKKSRAPAIAEAIDVIGKQVGTAIEGDTPEALTRAWNRIEKTGSVADLGGLLTRIRAGTDTSGVTKRIGTLMRRYPDDPRLAAFIHEQLDQLAYTASSSRGVWEAFFEVLDRVADPRTIAVIGATRPRWDRKLANRGGYRTWFLASMDRALAAANGVTAADVSREALAPIFALGQTVETAGERAHARLFEQVYRDPADDLARSVLADALLEANDPRGELIQLQLLATPTADQRRRMKELVETHGRAWLGALADFVSKAGLVYERGFATRVTVTKPKGKDPSYPMSVPESTTIVTLEIATSLRHHVGGGVFELREGVKEWIRTFPNVRRLEIGSFAALGQLVADGPVEYQDVVVRTLEKAPWLVRRNFPYLRRLLRKGNMWIDVTDAWFASQQTR